MVRIGRDYYNAVSVMKRNPKGKHLAGATAKQQRQYEAILKSIKKSGRYKGREKEVAARTVRARAKNKSGKGKQALKTTGRALKSAARGILGAGSHARRSSMPGLLFLKPACLYLICSLLSLSPFLPRLLSLGLCSDLTS